MTERLLASSEVRTPTYEIRADGCGDSVPVPQADQQTLLRLKVAQPTQVSGRLRRSGNHRVLGLNNLRDSRGYRGVDCLCPSAPRTGTRALNDGQGRKTCPQSFEEGFARPSVTRSQEHPLKCAGMILVAGAGTAGIASPCPPQSFGIAARRDVTFSVTQCGSSPEKGRRCGVFLLSTPTSPHDAIASRRIEYGTRMGRRSFSTGE
jgi:hypothetical protein